MSPEALYQAMKELLKQVEQTSSFMDGYKVARSGLSTLIATETKIKENK